MFPGFEGFRWGSRIYLPTITQGACALNNAIGWLGCRGGTIPARGSLRQGDRKLGSLLNYTTNPNPILTLGTEPRTLDLIYKYSTIKLNPQPHDPILKIKPGGCRDGPAIQSADQASLRTDPSNHETSGGSLTYLCDLGSEAHIDKRVAETTGLKPSEKHVFCWAKRPCLEGMNWRVIETHTPMPSCGPRESLTHKYAHLPRIYINNNKHQSPELGGLFQGDFYSLPSTLYCTNDLPTLLKGRLARSC